MGYPDAAISQHLELSFINVAPITLAYTRASEQCFAKEFTKNTLLSFCTAKSP